MRNNKKILVAFFVLLLTGSALYSQLGVTGYSVYTVCVNGCFDNTVTGELKLFTNSSLKYSEVEFDLVCDLSSTDYHSITETFNPFSGLVGAYCLSLLT